MTAAEYESVVKMLGASMNDGNRAYSPTTKTDGGINITPEKADTWFHRIEHKGKIFVVYRCNDTYEIFAPIKETTAEFVKQLS